MIVRLRSTRIMTRVAIDMNHSGSRTRPTKLASSLFLVAPDFATHARDAVTELSGQRGGARSASGMRWR